MNIMFVLWLVFGASIAAAMVWLLFLCRKPMTLCLTFDDGLADHHDIVAPLLAQYGWVGAFNVPTGFLEEDRQPLSEWQLRDCCLTGSGRELMTWADVCDLLAWGHEVYPHTVDHADLVDLDQAGRRAELVREIVESKNSFFKQTGRDPLYFCLPHNKNNQVVTSIIRKNGMEPFSCSRLNFGEPGHCNYFGTITEYLTVRYEGGCCHVDVMCHGIRKSGCGWRPFADVDAFKCFLDEIKGLEVRRMVKVVSYSSSHTPNCHISRLLRIYEWMSFRCRNLLFRMRRIFM